MKDQERGRGITALPTPTVHRVEEVELPPGALVYCSHPRSAKRRSNAKRQLILATKSVDGGGGGSAADAGDASVASNHGVEVLGGPSTGNDGLVDPQYIQPRIEIAPDNVEIEIELPPPTDSLATEFLTLPYRISESGKYEILGDREILRRKGTQRVPGVWP